MAWPFRMKGPFLCAGSCYHMLALQLTGPISKSSLALQTPNKERYNLKFEKSNERKCL